MFGASGDTKHALRQRRELRAAVLEIELLGLLIKAVFGAIA
jgi:hypothetical protein